jgi:DNA-binding GntR family transcriptional regulator
VGITIELDSRTLVTRITDELREQIVKGDLAPGTRIRQDEYAEALGVSRTPLREAFRLLEAEGWLQMRPRSGAVVSEFSPSEMQEILSMRLLLEPLAVHVAALNHSAEDADAISALHERWRRDRDGGATTGEGYDAANEEFHFRLYGALGQTSADPIRNSLRGYWDRYLRYRRVYYGQGAESMTHSDEEHEKILQAWLARDAEEAEARLAHHILGAGRALVTSLGEGPSDVSPELRAIALRYDFEM